MKTIYLSVAGAALFVALAAQSSHAAIINKAIKPGLNTLNDRDAAMLIDNVGANGKVDVGDMIESLLIVDNISNSMFGGTPLEVAVGDLTYQMTVHTIGTVISKVFFAPGPDMMVGTADDVFDMLLDFTADVYEDNSALAGTLLVDFSSQSKAAAIAAGTDGNLVLSLDTSGTGAGGASDKFEYIGADDFALLTTGNEANFVFALSMVLPIPPGGLTGILPDSTLSGLGGLPPGTGDLHDVVGVGEEELASAAVLARGWNAQSDTSISFTVVPEPYSLLVWAALVGCGVIAWKKRTL